MYNKGILKHFSFERENMKDYSAFCKHCNDNNITFEIETHDYSDAVAYCFTCDRLLTNEEFETFTEEE